LVGRAAGSVGEKGCQMAAHSSPRHHHKNTSSYHLGNFGHLANLLELKREHLAREAQINFQKLLLKVQDQIQSQGGAGMPTRELMLISVPGDPTPEQSLDKVQRKIKGLADIYNFSIPKFKVGKNLQGLLLPRMAERIARNNFINQEQKSEVQRQSNTALDLTVTYANWQSARGTSPAFVGWGAFIDVQIIIDYCC
jgi:hypothetical protein